MMSWLFLVCSSALHGAGRAARGPGLKVGGPTTGRAGPVH